MIWTDLRQKETKTCAFIFIAPFLFPIWTDLRQKETKTQTLTSNPCYLLAWYELISARRRRKLTRRSLACLNPFAYSDMNWSPPEGDENAITLSSLFWINFGYELISARRRRKRLVRLSPWWFHSRIWTDLRQKETKTGAVVAASTQLWWYELISARRRRKPFQG